MGDARNLLNYTSHKRQPTANPRFPQFTSSIKAPAVIRSLRFGCSLPARRHVFSRKNPFKVWARKVEEGDESHMDAASMISESAVERCSKRDASSHPLCTFDRSDMPWLLLLLHLHPGGVDVIFKLPALDLTCLAAKHYDELCLTTNKQIISRIKLPSPDCECSYKRGPCCSNTTWPLVPGRNGLAARMYQVSGRTVFATQRT